MHPVRILSAAALFASFLVVPGAVSAQAASAQAASDGDKVLWRYASWGKARAWTALADNLPAYLAERTGGRFVLQMHYGDLSPEKEIPDGISIGAFEAGSYVPAYYPGKMLPATAADLPFLPIVSLAQQVRMEDAYMAHPVLRAELDRWKAFHLATLPNPTSEILGRGEPPRSLEDWKGRRVRILGPAANALRELGAVTVGMPATELYTAVERNIADAAAFPMSSHKSYRIFEVARWYTNGLSIAHTFAGIMVNKAAFDRLPPEYQKLLREYAVDEGYARSIAGHEVADAEALATFQEAKLQEIAITPELHAEFREKAAKPAWAKWVQDLDKAGYEGQKLLDTLLAHAEEFKDAKF